MQSDWCHCYSVGSVTHWPFKISVQPWCHTSWIWLSLCHPHLWQWLLFYRLHWAYLYRPDFWKNYINELGCLSKPNSIRGSITTKKYGRFFKTIILLFFYCCNQITLFISAIQENNAFEKSSKWSWTTVIFLLSSPCVNNFMHIFSPQILRQSNRRKTKCFFLLHEFMTQKFSGQR